MYALPEQSVVEGLADLQTAISYQPEHLSWYQLTIEPNTAFYKKTPPLPAEDESLQLEEEGLALLKHNSLIRYEISAFAQSNQQAQHNLNYWLFGDYLGIGAGAHGKLTTNDAIIRTQKQRQPKDYLNPEKMLKRELITVSAEDLIFEFMLNTTRLEQKIPLALFNTCTQLPVSMILPKLKQAQQHDFIHLSDTYWQVTAHGRRYTNNLQALFLPM